MTSHVFDGDTIKIINRGRFVTLRLYGIDTPEKDQPFSKNAKSFLQSLILHRSISYLPLYYDDYGRLVAHAYLGNQSINQIMVEKGLAWVHIYYCDQDICDEWKYLQQESKNDKAGLWQESTPVPPWVWKRRRR